MKGLGVSRYTIPGEASPAPDYDAGFAKERPNSTPGMSSALAAVTVEGLGLQSRTLHPLIRTPVLKN